MTRKYFIKLAKMLNERYQETNGQPEKREELMKIANELGKIFQEENPRFNWSKWENAIMKD